MMAVAASLAIAAGMLLASTAISAQEDLNATLRLFPTFVASPDAECHTDRSRRGYSE